MKMVSLENFRKYLQMIQDKSYSHNKINGVQFISFTFEQPLSALHDFGLIFCYEITKSLVEI